jgi:hypothetical protein
LFILGKGFSGNKSEGLASMRQCRKCLCAVHFLLCSHCGQLGLDHAEIFKRAVNNEPQDFPLEEQLAESVVHSLPHGIALVPFLDSHLWVVHAEGFAKAPKQLVMAALSWSRKG